MSFLSHLQVDPALVEKHYSLMLGLYGISGLSGLVGIRERGHISKDGKQTCVVSGAAGSCGSVAGQVSLEMFMWYIWSIRTRRH